MFIHAFDYIKRNNYMLEYEDMSSERYRSYEKYDCDLVYRAKLKVFMMRYALRELDKDQIFGKKELPEGYNGFFLEIQTPDEKEFMISLLEKYPGLTEEKLGCKYVLEGEYWPG